MFVCKMLIKRNLLLYFRDKSAVFFSMLASLITICLYLFFINGSIVNDMGDKVKDIEVLKVFLNGLVLCGVISLNAFTIPLSFMNMLIHDKQEGILKDFYVSPVKKSVVMFSYIFCSVIATIMINCIVAIVLIVYLNINNVFVFTLRQGITVLLFYILANFLFSLIAFFIANFIKTSNAYGSLIGLSSALIGFLSGIYMPIGNFGSKTIETIITLFPITQLNAVLRENYLGEVTHQLFLGAPIGMQIENEYYFGIKLTLFGNEITLLWSIVYYLILFTLFILLSHKFVKNN